jgi:uncharacterized protein DUF4407
MEIEYHARHPMTNSVASERTPRRSSLSRYVTFSSPNLLKRFFLMCSGATRELLYAPSCITELNKYSMLGAIIFFTAGFAALSGGYAAYTAFRDPAVATALGVLWGLFIFTLDRLIVSGIRKQQHEPSDTWSVLVGKSLRGLLQAFPRIVLAVFLSIVIATPLELKLFEREIQLYLAQDTQMRAIEAEQLANEEFPELENLRTRNTELLHLLQAKEERRDTLRDQAFAEAEGLGGTHMRGKGPVYADRRAEFESYQKELDEFRRHVNTQIAANNATLTSLEAQKQQRLVVVKTVAEDAHGLLARLNALHQLARDRENLALGWAILFIFFIFLAVETAPVLTKVMSGYGPYDKLLERRETEVLLQEGQQLRGAQERITAAAQYRRNMESAMRRVELQQLQVVMQHMANDPQLRQAHAALTAQMTAQVIEKLSQDLATLCDLSPDAPDPSGVRAYQSTKAAFARHVAEVLAHARNVKRRTEA